MEGIDSIDDNRLGNGAKCSPRIDKNADKPDFLGACPAAMHFHEEKTSSPFLCMCVCVDDQTIEFIDFSSCICIKSP